MLWWASVGETEIDMQLFLSGGLKFLLQVFLPVVPSTVMYTKECDISLHCILIYLMLTMSVTPNITMVSKDEKLTYKV